MAMKYGTKPPKTDDVSSSNLEGLTKEIYDGLKTDFVDPAIDEINKISDDAMSQTQKQDARIKTIYFYKALSFSVGQSVVEHIKTNMEVKGIKAQLDNPAVATTVNTTVAPGILLVASGYPGATTGPGTGTGTGNGQVTTPSSTQSNDGTGHVE